MKTAHLYINAKGYPVNRHSYSGSSTFNHCARKYYLERVAGYKEKALEKSASMAFGRVMEDAVKMFHARGLDAAWAQFDAEWTQHKKLELDYSEKLGSWGEAWETGNEMLRLYAIRYPAMPFEITGADNFQYLKKWEVFPNTTLAGIELYSYIDVLAKLKPGRFVDAKTSRVILDMKVSAAKCPTLVALDPQLRTYSMVTNYPVVGFLWFGINTRTLEKGTEVTFLENVGPFKAGNDGIVLSLDYKDIPTNPASVYMAPNRTVFKEFSNMVGQKKADKEARLNFIEKNGIIVPISYITRQTIEVSLTVINQDGRDDMRKQIQQDIIRIQGAAETEFWPMQGGVRYPNNKCVTCSMRGICSGNDELRDELLEKTEEPVF